jgi:hypothetical protein
MLTFVARAFEGFLGVILWLNLVGCAITGAIMGKTAGTGYGILGFILGAIVGIATNIVFGGLIVTIVNMGKELSEFRKEVKKISRQGNITDNNVDTATSAPIVARSYEYVDSGNKSGICPNCNKPIIGSGKNRVCNYCGWRG